MKQPHLALSALAVACALAAVVAAAPRAQSSSPIANHANIMGVRVQWIDLAGNHPHTECTVHIVNTSLTTPITIEQFTVLGPGGRIDVIGTSPSTVGTTIDALGELRVPIDTGILGAAPQTSVFAYGVRNAIITWSGPADAVHLEAIQERYATGQTSQRTHWVSSGYAITD